MRSGGGIRRGAYARAIIAALMAAITGMAAAQDGRTGGPYVPTPQEVVDEMLKTANVTQKDHVIDLGSGDGRIVLTAARRYRATGVGVDIDEELVAQSNAEAQRDGLAGLARFRRQDVLETPLRDASVVTLYLLPEMMRTLRSRMLFELRPGARIVSHDFDFADWKPDRKVVVELKEKYNTTGSFESNVFLWVVPARVQGQWRFAAGPAKIANRTLEVRQEYQTFEGTVRAGARTVGIAGGRLDGARIAFRVPGREDVSGDYRGTVNGESMRGEVLIDGVRVPWSATRVSANP